jgi:hypothetical protein
VNQVLDELLLDEVVEFSRITGKPVHELLGITKEQLDELCKEDAYEHGRKHVMDYERNSVAWSCPSVDHSNTDGVATIVSVEMVNS